MHTHAILGSTPPRRRETDDPQVFSAAATSEGSSEVRRSGRFRWPRVQAPVDGQALKPTPRKIVHDTQGAVDVALTVDPALRSQQGERIQLLPDGHAAYVGPSASPAQTLHDVERTEHAATAQMLARPKRTLGQ